MRINQRVAVVAPAAGFLLGFLDFVWIRFMPDPFAGLGNSIAVWAVAAFLLTYVQRWPMSRAVAGAVVMLVVAVPSYYVAAALIQNDDWSNIWEVTSWLWMVLGVVAGVVFGAGGVIARRPGRLRLPALGLPAAVLFAETIKVWVSRNVPVTEAVQYSLVLAALAVLATVLLGRSRRERALALACAVPLAGLGYLLMIVTVFGR